MEERKRVFDSKEERIGKDGVREEDGLIGGNQKKECVCEKEKGRLIETKRHIAIESGRVLKILSFIFAFN